MILCIGDNKNFNLLKHFDLHFHRLVDICSPYIVVVKTS